MRFDRVACLKILHVTPLYHPAKGGAERHARIVSERLASRGHDVTVLTVNVENDRDLYHRVEGRLPGQEMVGGVRVVRQSPGTDVFVRLLEGSLRVRGSFRILSRLFTPDGLEMLRRFPRNCGTVRSILRGRPDVVGTWNWYWPSAFHAYLARAVRSFPLVGIPLFHTAESWAYRPLYERMIDACDGMIVNTTHERDFVCERVTDPPPVTVAGVGIDPADFEGADACGFRKRHGVGDVPLVGFVGRMIPNKGADRVVRAMSVVWRSCPDARLVLAGHRGNPFPELDRLMETLGAEERARILQLPDFPEEEKANLMRALDLLVVPSTGESFGIVYLEAWACGTPVIGSAIGSTGCVIDNGVDGLLVDPDDPGAVGEAILQLLTDPERRAGMGERGRRKTLRHHTWERVTDDFEELYGRLADQGSATSRTGNVRR